MESGTGREVLSFVFSSAHFERAIHVSYGCGISPDVPLPPNVVFDQLCDMEKIFRLNPYWICSSFSAVPGKILQQGTAIRLKLEDPFTGVINHLNGSCSRYQPPSRLTLRYETSTRLYTRFFVVGTGAGSRITVEETYSDREDEERFRLHHQQLEFWVHAIIDYMKLLSQTGIRASINRWLMDAVWIPGTPRGRRISALALKLMTIPPALPVK